MNEEDMSQIAEADGKDNAAELIQELGRKHRAISIIDEFEEYIRRHARELNQTQLYRFAILDLLAKSHDKSGVI